MAKTVADLLIERLIDWGVDTFSAFPETASTGSSKRFAPERTRSDLSRFATRRRLRLRPAAMPNTPAASACVSRRPVPAAFICSMAFTTPSAMGSRYSPYWPHVS